MPTNTDISNRQYGSIDVMEAVLRTSPSDCLSYELSLQIVEMFKRHADIYSISDNKCVVVVYAAEFMPDDGFNDNPFYVISRATLAAELDDLHAAFRCYQFGGPIDE